MDEFGNFAKIPTFDNKLTVGGGRGIRFNLFIQSLSQLDEKYGKEIAITIKSNCQTWIYLQSDDMSTLEEISKKLGNYTVGTYSLSTSNKKATDTSSSSSVNLTSRALLDASEVRKINRPYNLILSRKAPCLMKSPDLSKWGFNELFGLGDEEENIKVRERRERGRKERGDVGKVELWGIEKKFK